MERIAAARTACRPRAEGEAVLGTIVIASPSPSGGQKLGRGPMKKRFPGSYPLGTADYEKLWRDAIFVFDASALLNIYSFSAEARRDVITALEGLKDALWMPHQFAQEYQRNRRKVLREQIDLYNAAEKLLQQAEDQFLKSATTLLNERFVRVEVKDSLASVFKDRKAALSEHRTLHKNLLTEDYCHEKLSELFGEHLGPEPTHAELQEMVRVAEERYRLFIPPGWADVAKKKDADMHPYGDCIAWQQLLAYVKAHPKPVILVTDDMKPDWWQFDPGKTIVGPLPELRTEFRLTVGHEFYMYRLEQFVLKASDFKRAEVKPETLKEARELESAEREAAAARSDAKAAPQNDAKAAPQHDSDAERPKKSGEALKKSESE